ncbi:MAG: hypothetical protein WAX04_10610 [Oscillospiraceae bacterium]
MNKQKKFTKKKAQELCLRLFGTKNQITSYLENGYELLLGALHITMWIAPFNNYGEGDIYVHMSLDGEGLSSRYYDYETLEDDYKANEQYKNEIKQETIATSLVNLQRQTQRLIYITKKTVLQSMLFCL